MACLVKTRGKRKVRRSTFGFWRKNVVANEAEFVFLGFELWFEMVLYFIYFPGFSSKP